MKRGLSYPLLLAISFFVGLVLSVYPLPQSYAWYRPEIVGLLVVYWVLSLPQRLGMLFAWSVGLLLDVVEGGVWGANALGLTFVAYICQVSYRRLRSYSLTQQTFWVFVFIGVHQVFTNWVQSLSGYSVPTRYMFVATLLTAVLWPMLVVCLRRLHPVTGS